MNKPIKNTVQLITKLFGLENNMIEKEEENAQYEAYTFEVHGRVIKFRMARVTPKKIGQFVAFYKRAASGVTVPYDRTDECDFLIVGVFLHERYGQFMFPKSALIEHDILSTQHRGGKRAFRLYPPWDEVHSVQAKISQRWQLQYFIEINGHEPINVHMLERLFVS